MTFLSKTWGKKPILVGLSTHFALWWAFSVWVFTRGFGNFWSAMGQVAIAPVYLGIFYLYHGSYLWEWGAAGLLVSLALIGMIFLSIRKCRLWVVLLAHVVVVLYWVVGLLLVAAGD